MIDTKENFGTALRRLRTAKGLSVRQLADLARMSKSKICAMEHADGRTISPDDAQHLDTVLESGLALTSAARRARVTALPEAAHALLIGPNKYTGLAAGLQPVSNDPTGVDAVERRTFIQAGAIIPALALEATRHSMNIAMSTRDEATVDEWLEIAEEHDYNYLVTPPQELIEILTVDMIAIQYAIRDSGDTPARDLQRASSVMATLTAMTLSNLGNIRESRRWWRTARTLADQSGDPGLRAKVRGGEVVRALYERRPVDAVLAMAATYQAELHDVPGYVLRDLHSGRAQALAVAGRATEAAASLHLVEQAHEASPQTFAPCRRSALDWADNCVYHCRSFAYAFTGDYDEAESAQQATLALYPSTDRRGRAQIGLQRAICFAKAGDAGEAARTALAVLDGLPAGDHTRPVLDLSRRVLHTFPAGAARAPEVREYRDLLSTIRLAA
jgi:transcriptional regulator with XRE-family HTH domain